MSNDFQEKRRQFLASAPAIAIGAAIGPANAASAGPNKPSIVKADELRGGLEFIKRALSKRRMIRLNVIQSAAKTVCKAADIDVKDFFAVADGRLDMAGNYVAPNALRSFAASLDALAQSASDTSYLASLSEQRAALLAELSAENRVAELSKDLFVTYRGAVHTMERRIRGAHVQDELHELLNSLAYEYRRLCSSYGSLIGLYSVNGARAPLDRATATNWIAWAEMPRKLFGDQYDTDSVCCQINMMCEPDTIDCGFFDWCEHDACGAMDDVGPCIFYDDATDER